jgi:hypothetical protein
MKKFSHFRTDQCSNKYKVISSKCTAAIRDHVHKQESLIDNGNVGKFYRYANSNFIRKTNVGPLELPNGVVTVDPATKDKLLNEYFSSVFTVDESRALSVALVVIYMVYSKLNYQSIHKLKLGSASGPDGIPATFFSKLLL